MGNRKTHFEKARTQGGDFFHAQQPFLPGAAPGGSGPATIGASWNRQLELKRQTELADAASRRRQKLEGRPKWLRSCCRPPFWRQ